METRWKQKILSIWFGQSVSLLTSSVLQFAVIWYITAKTGSATMLVFATIAGFLPQALLGPFAGVFLDRYSKKSILILADTMVALASFALAFWSMVGELPLWFIYVMLAVRSVGTAFHEPAAQSITPLFVPAPKLTQYAGYSQAFDSVCMLLSPALASVLYNALPLHWVLLSDVLGAFLAVSILATIKFPKEASSANQGKPLHIWQETKEGLAYVRKQPGIWALMVVAFLYTIIYSPVGSLYPHMTMNYFGGTTQQSSLVEIAFSVGTLLGAMALGAFAHKLPKPYGLWGSMAVYGTGIAIIGSLAPDGYWIFLALSFFTGMSTPFYHGIVRAIYQLTIPQEYLGRTFAISQSAKRLGMPIGLLFGGPFADLIGINRLYQLMGVAAILMALVCARIPSLKHFKDL